MNFYTFLIISSSAILFFFSNNLSFAANTNCRPPHRLSVVQAIANKNPQTLSDSCQSHGGTWEFMDKVVSKLRSEDQKWGYNCKRGNCNDPSHDAIAYYCGGGTPNSRSTNVAIIDIITAHCPGNTGATPRPGWLDVTQATVKGKTVGRWLYPRPGGPTVAIPPDPNKACLAIYTEATKVKDLLKTLVKSFQSSCGNFKTCQKKVKQILTSGQGKGSPQYPAFRESCNNYRQCRNAAVRIYESRDSYDRQVASYNRQCQQG